MLTDAATINVTGLTKSFKNIKVLEGIDLQRGIIERFKSLPTVSWGVLMGHVTADLVRNIIQSLIMIIVALPVATYLFRRYSGR